MRKTKIVCTMGPSTYDISTLRAMMLAGMNVARINFSHETLDKHKQVISDIRKVSRDLNLNVAILADTKGPEIRLCSLNKKKITLTTGQKYTLTTRDIIGNESVAPISYSGLPKDVSVGNHILIDDGNIDLEVESVEQTEIHCVVIDGGVISPRKGINVPGVKLSMPFLTDSDKRDLKFIAENDFDFVAASFVRCAQDVVEMRKYLAVCGASDIQIISKIENTEGLRNFEEILEKSEGVMVARGDLGVEIPFEEIPVLQKSMIKSAYTKGKYVITATQMLESMINNPRPTRAECADVANAIYDGTSAVMLSGETAAGQYPVESVMVMDKIARRTESEIDYKKLFLSHSTAQSDNPTDAIALATCAAAHHLKASAILTVTNSGNTSRNVAKYRPHPLIIGCSENPEAVRRMCLSWGVYPLLLDSKSSVELTFEAAVNMARDQNLVADGDVITIAAGLPLGVSGTTNTLKVHKVGDEL